MKAAAAVLGASLLFFLGVLTGIGRRETVPPPTAIPLGVATPAGSSNGAADTPATRSPAPPRTPRTTARAGASPTTASTVTTTSVTTAPTGSGPSGNPATTPQPTATTATTVEPTTSTTAASGGVEQVDGQVDCAPAGKRGKGQREPCPSTTTSTAAGARGGNNR